MSSRRPGRDRGFPLSWFVMPMVLVMAQDHAPRRLLGEQPVVEVPRSAIILPSGGGSPNVPLALSAAGTQSSRSQSADNQSAGEQSAGTQASTTRPPTALSVSGEAAGEQSSGGNPSSGQSPNERTRPSSSTSDTMPEEGLAPRRDSDVKGDGADRATGVPKASDDDLRFRRVFVPADRIETWPLEDQRYVPVPAAEFEELVEILRVPEKETHRATAPLLVTAEYAARLEGTGLVEGTATLDVEAKGQLPALLDLGTCNLAMSQLRWLDADMPDALVGWASNGSTRLVVQQPGKLAFAWSLASVGEDPRELSYALRFPPSLKTTLDVTLPSRLRPLVTTGLVTLRGSGMDDHRIWRIELGGQTQTDLRLVQDDPDEGNRVLPGMRQTMGYDLSPKGMEISARLELDAESPGLQELEIVLDPGIRLLSARLGDVPLRWTVETRLSRELQQPGQVGQPRETPESRESREPGEPAASNAAGANRNGADSADGPSRDRATDQGGFDKETSDEGASDAGDSDSGASDRDTNRRSDTDRGAIESSESDENKVNRGEGEATDESRVVNQGEALQSGPGENQPTVGEAPNEGAEEHPASGPTSVSQQQRVARISFPQPLQGIGRVLKITAMAPLSEGAMVRLPEMRPLGVFWEQGEITLRVLDPYHLESLSLDQARQTAFGRLVAPLTGQLIELQAFHPTASIHVVLNRRISPLEIQRGTRLTLDPGGVSATIRAQLHSEPGERVSIEADVSPSWRIDSLESEPAEAIKSWTVGTSPRGQRVLQILLADPSVDADLLTLNVRAHRAAALLKNPLRIGDCEVLRFHGSRVHRDYLGLQTVDAYRMRLIDLEADQQFDPAELDEGAVTLLREADPGPVAPQWPVFDMQHVSEQVSVILQRRDPSFTGQITMTAEVGPERLFEAYQIRVQPDPLALRQIWVQFSTRREDPLQWHGETSPRTRFTARRLTREEQLQYGLGARGETWEIEFLDPVAEALTLSARRSSPLVREMPVSLASLAQATTQSGSLTLRGGAGRSFSIDNRRLRSIPQEVSSINRYRPARAAFRYSPASDADPASEAALVIRISDETLARRGAIIWSHLLETRCDVGGHHRHISILELESLGQSSLELKMPPSADTVSVWIDGLLTQGRFHNGVLRIPLPRERRFSTIAVHFTAEESSLGTITPLESGFPEPTDGATVLARQRTIWLPPGYELDVASQRGPDAGSLSDFQANQPDHAGQGVAHQMRRLFGPLVKGDPGDGIDATPLSLATGGLFHAAQARNELSATIEALGPPRFADESLRFLDQTSGDWASLLRGAQAQLAGEDRALLIDRRALQRSGCYPRSWIEIPADEDNASQWATLLEEGGLVLLVHERVVLLTSAFVAAQLGDHIRFDHQPSFAWLERGPLALSLAEAAQKDSSLDWVPPQRWHQRLAPVWPIASFVGQQPADHALWRAYYVGGASGGDSPLRVVHANTLRVWGWGVFLAALGAGWYVRRHRRVWTLPLLGLAATVALCLPEMFRPLGVGGFLGVLVAAVAGLFITRTPMTARSVESSDAARPANLLESTSSAAARLALVLLTCSASWLLAPAGPVRAQNDTRQNSSPTYRVLIPSEGKATPSGDRYHVPHALYQQLLKRASELTDSDRAWLLTGAVYRGSFVWDKAGMGLFAEQMEAVFDLHVIRDTREVVLPFDADALFIDPQRTRLDGEIGGVRWDQEAGLLRIDSLMPGSHRVEVGWQAPIRSEDGISRLRLKIPPLVSSRCEFKVPPEAPLMRFPTATGGGQLAEDGQTVRAALGPADQLDMEWADRPRAEAQRPTADVQELLWLDVQPGAVVLHSRLHYQVQRGQIDRIRLELDPRLRIQRLRPAEKIRPEVKRFGADGTMAEIRLRQPVADELTIEGTYLLEGTAGVGAIPLPMHDPRDVRSHTRMLAISIAPQLQYSIEARSEAKSLPVDQFLAEWGPNETRPQLAYHMPTRLSQWTLRTWPKPTELATQQVMLLTLHRSRADVHYRAGVSIQRGPVFRYRLDIPPEIVVQDVSVIDDEGIQRVDHWAREARQGQLEVFLNAPCEGGQTVSLVGEMPIPGEGKFALPNVRLIDVESSSYQVRIYRDASVTAQMDATVGLRALDDAPVLPLEMSAQGRLVTALTADDTQFTGLVHIRPNEPVVQGVQMTMIRREQAGWEAEATYQLHVEQGTLDVLRMEVPQSFNGPFLVVPPSSAQLIELPGEESRRLLIRPRKGISGDYRLTVRGPLQVPPNRQMRVPRFDTLNIPALERYLVLPTQFELQQVAWETRGLLKTDLPEAFEGPPVGSDAYDSYHIVADEFEATLRSVQRAVETPHVPLVDVRIACRDSGEGYGTVSFDLYPGGSTTCPLWVPEGVELLDVTVEDIPATAAPKGPGRWQLDLGPAQFPHHIEVVFRSKAKNTSQRTGACRLAVPRLGDLPVEQTVWTVHGTGSREVVAAEGTALVAIQPLRRDWLRLQSAAGLLDRAAQRVADQRSSVIEPWYGNWSRRLETRRRDVQSAFTSADTELAETVEDDLRSIHDRQSEIAKRLRVPDQTAYWEDAVVVADQAPLLWSEAVGLSEQPSVWLQDGGPEALSLGSSRGWWHRQGQQGPWVVIALLGTIMVSLPRGRQRISRVLRRWPQLVMVCAAVAWTLWLVPPWIGWILMAVALWTALRGPGIRVHGDASHHSRATGSAH